MKFLVVAEAKNPIPPEMVQSLGEELANWRKTHTESKKLESAWGLAGVRGGAMILTVSSHEELDRLLFTHPMTRFSEVKVYALADLDERLKTLKQTAQQMARPMGGNGGRR